MAEVFKSIASISNPLAVAGISLIVLLYIMKVLAKLFNNSKLNNKQTYRLYRRIINSVLVTALLSLFLSLSGYAFSSWIEVNPHEKKEKYLVVKGSILIDKKVCQDARVRILELEKETLTNEFGGFLFLLDPTNYDSLTFNIDCEDSNVDTMCIIGVNHMLLPLKIELQTKKTHSKKHNLKPYNKMICDAHNYYRTNGMVSKETALKLYHQATEFTINNIKCDPSINKFLKLAENDYKQGHIDDALLRYDKAFELIDFNLDNHAID